MYQRSHFQRGPTSLETLAAMNHPWHSRVFEEYQTYRDADTGEREMDAPSMGSGGWALRPESDVSSYLFEIWKTYWSSWSVIMCWFLVIKSERHSNKGGGSGYKKHKHLD